MAYTDQQLLDMLADLESDLVERKESFKGEAPNTTREAVCAFANDLQGPSIINRPRRRSHTSSQSSQSKLTLLMLTYANTPVIEQRGLHRFAGLTSNAVRNRPPLPRSRLQTNHATEG